MKKLLLIVALAGVMVACNSKNRRQAAEQVEDAVTETVQNVQAPRDISGTYNGTLPTASGSGMDVTIVLSGKEDFKKSFFYVGEDDKSYESSGLFVWNDAGTIITLVGDEVPNQYLVEDNRLIQLDIEGNRITGSLADEYVLQKRP